MTLSIITVNTNEWHVLQKCLRSVFEQTKGIEFEFIVVDNASTDGSREKIAQEYPQVKVLTNYENLGFAAANNRGIRQACGKYILLLNPDTEVLDNAIMKTVQFMESHPQAGIAACKLLFPNRSIQRSVRSFPTVWNVFCESTFLYRLFPKSTIFGKYYLAYFNYDTIAQVDWVCGAYIMISRRVIDTIGLLDEQFFMYTEEVDYCYRAKNTGYEIWYTPAGQVIHFWGGVNAINRRVMLWTYASQILYFQKHFRGVEKYLLIGLKYIGLLLRTILYAVVGCLLLKKQMFLKSYYALFSIYKMAVTPWNYKHNYTGKIVPWIQV
jgi:GT2 family glycosyltransferase